MVTHRIAPQTMAAEAMKRAFLHGTIARGLFREPISYPWSRSHGTPCRRCLAFNWTKPANVAAASIAGVAMAEHSGSAKNDSNSEIRPAICWYPDR